MGAWVAVVMELGGGERSYSLSCLLSLPSVWDVWTDMYICGIFPVVTDVQGWTPLWLAATFFSPDVNAKLALMRHSRQLGIWSVV